MSVSETVVSVFVDATVAVTLALLMIIVILQLTVLPSFLGVILDLQFFNL